MNHYQQPIIGLFFIGLCLLALIADHGIGLIGLFLLPFLALAAALIFRTFIESIINTQHHDF